MMRSSLFFSLLVVWSFFSCQPKPVDQHLEQIPKENLLEVLLEGNLRFAEDHPIHPDQTLERLRDLNQGQHPVAAIISCSDSRVPPELVFDQGLGDLFVIRNAGNIVSDYEIGSVEYAVEVLGVPLVIVMGHTNCGAIHAFADYDHDHAHIYPEYIQKIIDYIESEEEEKALPRNIPNFLERAIEANILHGVHELKKNIPQADSLMTANKLRIIGALYDMETGKVRLVEDQ
jgi:carbonic anhydrase